MSLILEALRKSERQRRLGQAPDLYAPMPIARASRRRRLSAWPLLALAIAIGAAWWFARDRDEGDTRVATPAASGRSGVRPDDTPATRATPSTSSPTTRGATPAPPRPAVAPPRQPDDRAGPVATSPLARPIPAVVPPPQAQQDPTTRPAPPPAAEIAAPAAPGTSTDPAADPDPPATTAAQAAPPAADAELLSLSQLSAAEREALPPLQVSMHVYADIPTRRFAIVDGQRVGEGARLGDGVVLVEIRRDGSVLDVNGRRVLLPRP